MSKETNWLLAPNWSPLLVIQMKKLVVAGVIAMAPKISCTTIGKMRRHRSFLALIVMQGHILN
jgi:hypothetical protein